ncbi:uncharacterized protein BYT42DRAFT_560494 [Radiomyces spectabilis]|uniref:uncharacterized protein n=1 Tax=Radiomyces spectabilis TaxID=64574 RepID=UPI00221E5959|nr:uncharacterized protein BYT42DRAFT_560494 [Radiomyces spectabilis]KAI8388555.1 hypothetical protein BYT42DRAFT_560494 [Radiomyces spectabilis]
MLNSSMQGHHCILIAVVLTLLFTASYFQFYTAQVVSGRAIEVESNVPAPGNEEMVFDLPLPAVLPEVTESQKAALYPPTVNACDQVDIEWLASDRVYWDGWTTKSMFISANGSFTTKDVHITEDTSVCVVVLLGPIPAKSSIRPEKHYGPADSILMTAAGNKTRIAVNLQQHAKQTNAYYASVYFANADQYRLEAFTEHRSYFWETPIYHAYRPFPFVSQNRLIVRKAPKGSPVACDLAHLEQVQGSWVLSKTGRYDFKTDQCQMAEMDPQLLQAKSIHVWGDSNIQRNLKALSLGDAWCNYGESRCLCHDDDDSESLTRYPWSVDPSTPLKLNNTLHGNIDIHYQSIGPITLRDVRSEVRRQADKLPAADLVIISIGNGDIPLSRLTSRQFAQASFDLLNYMLDQIYPYQTIVLRTPQFFGHGTLFSTSWNAARSSAFATVIRDFVASWKGSRNIVLWDTQKLGVEPNHCTSLGTVHSRRNVVDVENKLLLNLLYNTKLTLSSS